MSLHLVIDGRDACRIGPRNARRAFHLFRQLRHRARLAIFRG